MLRDLVLRARSLFRRDAVERDLDDELSFHLDQLTATFEREGLSPENARRRARLTLGGVDQIKEAHRDARGITLVTDLGRDVRHALRQVQRAPGFATLAVLCLGLGIGVNTTIFSVVNAMLLQTLPVAAGERLVSISRGDAPAMAYRAYESLRERTQLLDGLTASLPLESDLEVDSVSEFITSEIVPANYGSVLGVAMAAGRWFADDRQLEAVISHAVWQRRFNGSPEAIGRRIRSESQWYTVVGVAPAEFGGTFAPLRTDLWVPVRTRPLFAAALDKPGDHGSLRVLFGRLRADVTAAQAAAELNTLAAQLQRESGSGNATTPLTVDHVRGIPDPGMRRRTAMLSVLLGAVVGLVLLIACVNVGNLLLVRGALRQREFAVRRALGASRSRLLRQLLTESLVLAAGGGVCGVVLAIWTNRLLETSVPSAFGAFAVRLGLSVDWRAVIFALLVSLVTTILCGLWPAFVTSRAGSLTSFKGEIGGGRPRRRPVSLVAQVVMSLVLLFVAGSFVQALLRLYRTDPGFAVEGRLYAYTFLPTPPATAEGRQMIYRRALDQLRTQPGVRSAALTRFLPMMPIGSECAARAGADAIPASISDVGPGYFEAMGIDLVAGRDFTSVDQSSDAATIVLSQSLARRLWPGGSGLGERVMVGCKSPHAAVVAGIVRDSVITGLEQRAPAHIYRPLSPQFSGLIAIVVHTAADPAALVLPVRRLLLDLGQDLRVYTVQPLADHVTQRYAPFQWATTVITGFGTLALVLAAVGLYGVIAYRVALRTQELGVRMALGASRQEIFRAVLRQGLIIVVIGVVIGEVVTAALTGAAGALLSDIAPSGVTTHVTVALIWIVVALVACFVPAARAARVDPLVALRHE